MPSEWSGTLYGLGLCGRSAESFSAASSGERSPLFQPMRVNPIDDSGIDGLWQVPDAVNESGRVALISLPESATGNEGQEHSTSLVPAPLISDRHGDDRFADNILRACRNLPQHGDDEEERDAAEEGALIEASGYPDPQYERNGR